MSPPSAAPPGASAPPAAAPAGGALIATLGLPGATAAPDAAAPPVGAAAGPSPLVALMRRRALARLLADRRGVSTLVFAASSILVVGGLALAADVGQIYAARRGAQNAADAASAGAAVALAMTGRDAAIASGTDLAGRNGYAPGGANTVTVNVPPASGPNTSNPTAVEVIVRQQQSLSAAAQFLSPPPTVQGRAVATLRATSNVCLLALDGQITSTGNSTVNAPTCVLASNMRGTGSISLGGSFSLTAHSLSAVGTCVGCSGGSLNLVEPARQFHSRPMAVG